MWVSQVHGHSGALEDAPVPSPRTSSIRSRRSSSRYKRQQAASSIQATAAIIIPGPCVNKFPGLTHWWSLSPQISSSMVHQPKPWMNAPSIWPAPQCSSAVPCRAVQCNAVQCRVVPCSAMQCSALQCSAVQCSAVQCSQYSAVQCSAVLGRCTV